MNEISGWQRMNFIEGFENAIDVVQKAETETGDIEHGDVSAAQIVAIGKLVRQMGLNTAERTVTNAQISAIIGTGEFRPEVGESTSADQS
jgi:hypothetical protein